MIEFITQYAPFIVTGLGVVAPILPTMIVKAVSDRKAITTFEGIKAESSTQLTQIKALAESLKAKEEVIAMDVASMKNLTETFDSKISKIDGLVESKMKEVSDKVLGFQQDEIYQKMLNGLSQLDEMQKTSALKDQLIEKQAQVIKEIHQKLGSMK